MNGSASAFELSRAEATAGFFTPLAVFAVSFLAQVILPGSRLPGYVINPVTGEPRIYRRNGLLVFALALSGAAYHYELFGEDYNPRVKCTDGCRRESGI